MKLLNTQFFRNHFAKILSIFFFVLLSIAYVSTFAIFTPGETLNPNCAPGADGCIVSIGSGSSPWLTTSNNTYFNTGNVGIGTSTPTSLLDLKISTTPVYSPTQSFNPGNGFNPDTALYSQDNSSVTGLNDATFSGSYTGLYNNNIYVYITDTPGPDQFYYYDDQGDCSGSGSADIIGSPQLLCDGISVTFASDTGHTINDQWNYNITSSDHKDDATYSGTYTGSPNNTIYVDIDGLNPDTFTYYDDQGDCSQVNNITITPGVSQSLCDGISITFASDTGHSFYDDWTYTLNNSLSYTNPIINISDNIGNNYFTVNAVAPESNFIGTNAGDSATGASYSNFLGYYAGISATNASDSNFLGYQSGYSATSASSSNFLGNSAGNSATSASSSNFIGYYAGYFATSASNSNFLGYTAGYYAANASDSNFLGYTAGQFAAGAYGSNFLGNSAGRSATNASLSNFFGYRAGYSATNAKSSIFIGQSAGDNDTVDNTTNDLSSILIGSFTNTGGKINSILLGSGTSGSPIMNTKDNQFMLAPTVTEMRLRGVDYTLPSAVASSSGQVLTSDTSGVLSWETVSGGGGGLLSDASGNTKGGTNALPSTTGSSNTAIGFSSLYSNTSGQNNTANGSDSLSHNTIGAENTANGTSSLLYNTTGSSNTANGIASLSRNTTGTYNIGLGYGAGNFISGGAIANTTGDYNVFLGSNTKALADNDQNEIVIGYNAIGNGSNAATIGNSSLLRTYLTGVNLKAGTATAGTAPLKFTTSAGALLSPTEAGAMEFDGTHLYFTATDSGTRYQLDQQSGGSSPISIVNTSNLFSDAIGAGSGVTSIVNSNFFGVGAGNGATNSNRSNFLGYNAGYQAIYTENSNYLGYYAGYQATNASSSNFLGNGAGQSATYASSSNFLGNAAGQSAVNASNSNFLGSGVGMRATNASESNFLGGSAGYEATDAAYSNFIGSSAGYQAASASNSNFLGYTAGQLATNAANSIFIGQSAGNNDTVDNTTNGLSSILIGSFTNTGGFSNSIILGSGVNGSPISNTKINQFMLAPTVTEMRLRDVDYTLPASQGGASTVLTNNGSGGLTWTTVSGGSGLSSDADFNTKGGTSAGLNLVAGAQYNTFLGYEAGKSWLGTSTNAADNNTAIGYRSLYVNTTGYENVALGANALYANTGGAQNISIGSISLYSNTNGSGNIAIGQQTLSSNVTGSYNVAIGNSALTQNTGNFNVAVGASALYNTSASNAQMNTAVGYQALYSNTSYSNTGIGYEALQNNTSGRRNVGIGATSLFSNGVATDNTATGFESLFVNTGSYNTAFGSDSLSANTTGINNTALGYNSGRYITGGSTPNATSSNSVYLGYQTNALANGDTNEIVIGAATTGNGNNTATIGNSSLLRTYITGLNLKAGSATAGTSPLKFASGTVLGTTEAGAVEYDGTHLYFTATNSGPRYQLDQQVGGGLSSDADFNTKGGTNAGANLASGAGGNTFLGYEAGKGGAGGTNSAVNNVALGYRSLYLNISGANNTVIGTQSLYSNTTGGNNTSTGVYSLQYNTIGYSNTANGVSSLNQNISGYSNTANGYGSLYSNTTGSNNSGVGYHSGRYIANGSTPNQISNNSTYLGYDTRAQADGDTNETVIGYNTIGNGSNTVTLGNTSNLRTYLTGLNLKAGTATAGTAPLKFTTSAGALLSPTEGGAMEFDGTHLYFTVANAGTRYQLDQQGSGSLSLTTTGTSGAATLVGSTLNIPQYTAGTGLSSDADFNTKGGTNAGLNFTGVGAGHNTFLGYEAGKGGAVTLTADQNVAIGSFSLFSNTTGGGNTSAGVFSLNLNTTGYRNTALGLSSLINNTTGYLNTGIGSSSLNDNTTGNNNIAIGADALSYNKANSRSIAIGYQSMLLADNRIVGRDTYNIAIGYQALKGGAIPANNTGQYNIAIGDSALLSNTSGEYNTVQGYFSHYSNTTGYYNTASGAFSLYSNSNGYANTAYGMNSLYSNTSGAGNTANGNDSLNFLTTGGSNTAVGNASLYSLTSSSFNTAVGMYSGRYISGGSTANQLSSNSVYLGYNTKALANGDTNEIVIGYNVTGNGSNTTTIGTGNVLYIGGITGSNIVAQFTNGNGSCQINPTTGSLGCSSDINLKKNITTLGDNKEFALQTIPTPITEQTTLEKIMQITPVNYNWNAESNTDAKHIGFIAQEMEQIFPSIVSTDTKGTVDPITGKTIYLKSISYASITPYLVKGIQEMNLKIGDLQSLDTTQATSLGSLIIEFLSSATNNINLVFFGEVHAKKLCLDDVCITKDELNEFKATKVKVDELISSQTAAAGGSSGNNSGSGNSGGSSGGSGEGDNNPPTGDTPSVPPTLSDLTLYNEAIGKVVEADYTLESFAIYKVVIDTNIVTNVNIQADVDIATENIKTAQVSLEKVSI